METLQKIKNSTDDSKLRSLLFDNEETKRRIEIIASEKEIEERRLLDLIKMPSTSQQGALLSVK